jgi:hypothetical protein
VKNLLEEPVQRNYPEEYLIARIRGKRVRLIKDWEGLLSSPDISGLIRSYGYTSAGWSGLLKRYRWIYSEMNNRLRNLFWPYFVWIEFRTLFIFLRYLKGGYIEKAQDILNISLLSQEIKKLVVSGGDLESTVKELTVLLAGFYKEFLFAEERFLKKGISGFEIFMNNTLIEYLTSLKLNEPLRSFILYLADMRNIINLYKSIKWDIPLQDFIRGGRISYRILEELKNKGSLTGVSEMVRSITGFSGEIEDSLLKGLGRLLKKRSYEPDGKGLILYYLWCLYIENRNAGTILEGLDIERALLRDEII